jgi:hypothetical protein
MRDMASDNRSIHPRVENGRTRHEKSNTSAAPKRSTIERKIAAITAHLEEHPDNKVAEGHLAKLKTRLASLPAA